MITNLDNAEWLITMIFEKESDVTVAVRHRGNVIGILDSESWNDEICATRTVICRNAICKNPLLQRIEMPIGTVIYVDIELT